MKLLTIAVHAALVLDLKSFALGLASVSDAEEVNTRSREGDLFTTGQEFRQYCLIKETQDTVACRRLLFDKCGMDMLNRSLEKERSGNGTSHKRKCETILKQECKQSHFHDALCRALFLPDSIGRLGTNSALTTAMDDPFVQGVMNGGNVLFILGCNQKDEVEKLKCLGGKVKEGLELKGNISGGIGSVNDALDIFVGTLKFMGQLHPAVAAGVQVVRLFTGSSGGPNIDPQFKAIMERFDRLEAMIDDLQKEIIFNLSNKVEEVACNTKVQKYISAIERHQEAFDWIVNESLSKSERKKKLDKWEDRCLNGAAGENPHLYDLIGSFIDVMVVNDPFGMSLGLNCARSYYDSKAKNRPGKFYREVVKPVLGWLTKAMRLMQACTGITEAEIDQRQTEITTTLIERTFKPILQEAERNWKSAMTAGYYDWSSMYPRDVRIAIMDHFSLEYHYEIVWLQNKNPGDHGRSHLGSSNSDDYGLIHITKNKVRNSHIYVFYRRKERGPPYKTYGQRGIVWKNKNSSCNNYMCSKPGRWYGCVNDHCHSPWHLIRMPSDRGNQDLENKLERSGSIMYKTSSSKEGYTGVSRQSMNYFYQLDKQTLTEGNDDDKYTYDLIYPKYKKVRK